MPKAQTPRCPHGWATRQRHCPRGSGLTPGWPLRQKLPAEVLVGGNAVWSRYRQYPVFGLRWLLGRSLLFCGVIAVVAAFIGFWLIFDRIGLIVNAFPVQGATGG